jgi:diguanylate cyclase (GGDEF)-like protein/PAS domain S-box-containing protein
MKTGVMKVGLLLLFFFLPGLSLAAETFHLGIFAYRPVEIIEKRWQHLETYLEQQVPNSDFVLHILQLDELEKGVQQNRFDFVFTNPRHFIEMRSKYPLSGALGTLVRLEGTQPVSALGGVIFTLKAHQSIASLADIEGKRIAAPGNGFLGGYQAPLYELHKAGIDISHLDVVFTGSPHDKVLQYLRDGKADVGFVRTSALEQMAAEGQVSMAELNIINEQRLSDYPFVTSTRLFPEWPFIALPKVRESTARRVASAILALEPNHPVSQKIGISGFTVPADYLPVELSMRELGLPPFDVEPNVSLMQIWQQHNVLIIALVMASGLILLLLLVIARQNYSLRLGEQKVTQYLQEIEKRHQFLRSTFSAIPDLVWIKDPNGVYLDCNSRYESFMGKARNNILGQTDHDHIPSQQASQIHIHDQEVLRLRLPSIQEEVYQFKSDGHEEVLEIIKTPILDAANEIIGMLGIGRDITSRKKAEEELRLSREVFENTLEGIMITDRDGIIVDVNPAFNKITGYERQDVLGQNPAILNSGRQSPAFYEEMWRQLQQRGFWKGEVWNRNKNGEIYAEQLSISSLTDENGFIEFFVGIFSDITRSKEQQEQLSMMAHYDVLTSLPNRALFADRFSQAIMHSKRNQTLLAICFIDLDNFKPVNDNFGHETGDQLLVEVAKRLLESVRGEDTVSRLGGDEFALLLNDINSEKECMRTLDRILHKLEMPFVINGHSHYISASIGTTLYPRDDEDVDTLLRHADQAMYQAKIAGKHRYNLFDSHHDKVVTQKQLIQDQVKKALYADELTLFYQPKINMASGEVLGVEALLRWQHPEKGLIPPLNFLPQISNTELEVEVGEWVIQQALRQLHEWSTQGIEMEISVNIASHHLQQPSFVSRLAYALDEYPELNPGQLQLEVLESSVLADLNKIRETIDACQNTLGVSVALDDFGTGYSSLTHLRSFSADTVKIDKSFIQDMLDDPNDYVIVDGVIGLAGSFSRKVIAEGVESRQHGLMLLAMGCELAQGFGIARPMPAKEFQTWLKRYRPEQSWLDYAARTRSLADNKSTLLNLTFKHWHARFLARLNANQDSVLDWPIMDTSRCHCGVWIEAGQKEQLFKASALSELSLAHDAYHANANELFALCQQKEFERARQGLANLNQAYERMLSAIVACQAEALNPDKVVAGYSRGYL